MDMVMAIAEGYEHNPTNDPIKVAVDGDWLISEDHKTSLGSDDGIGVAMMLAAADGEIAHGPLRLFVTVDEEDMQTGAKNLDPTLYSGCAQLINIDSETDGEVTISSAANDAIVVTGRYDKEVASDLSAYKIEIKNFRGGHSGLQINEGRLNANVELAVFLEEFNRDHSAVECQLVSFSGGDAGNAISPHAEAVVVGREGFANAIQKAIATATDQYRSAGEKGCSMTCVAVPGQYDAMSVSHTTDFLRFLTDLRGGVNSWSTDVPELVESSYNLGKVQLDTNCEVKVTISARSSVEAKAQEIKDYIFEKAERARLVPTYERQCYPWPANPSSELLATMTNCYKQLFGEEMKVVAVHAGLECGIFNARSPQVDMVSFGPTIVGPHTVNEKCNIPTVSNNFRLLEAVLAEAPAIPPAVFSEAKKVGPWFYEVEFYDYSPEAAEARGEKSAVTDVVGGGCSAFSDGGFFGRNMDWCRNTYDYFAIRTPANPEKNRRATLGIVCGMNHDFGGTSTNGYELLPYYTMDGINDCGVTISANLAARGDMGYTVGIHPGLPRLSQMAATRTMLDGATNAAHAVEILLGYDYYAFNNSEFQFLISDEHDTYLVEFTNNLPVVMTNSQFTMANFYNCHSKVAGTADEETYAPHGIERFVRMNSNRGKIHSVDDMFKVMQNEWYSQLWYVDKAEKFWSENNGGSWTEPGTTNTYNFYEQDGGRTNKETVGSTGWARLQFWAECEMVWKYYLAEEQRTGIRLDTMFWQSAESMVYDITNRTLYARLGERDIPYVFTLGEPVHTNRTEVFINGDNVGIATNCNIEGCEWTYDVATSNIVYTGTNAFTVTGLEGSGLTLTRTAENEPIPVEEAWVGEKFPEVNMPSAILNNTGTNDYPVWQSYLLDLDPADADSKLTATFEVVDGALVVRPEPESERLAANGYRYVIEGKTNITDDVWMSPTNSLNRFFVIKVEKE